MMHTSRQTGFTLVELLVAIALGILLLGIITTIYLGSKATFQAATGVARSQEATRFAMDFLKRDIRMSGYFGCSEGASVQVLLDPAGTGYSPSIDNAIFGWEYTGTGAGDTFTLNYQTAVPSSTDAQIDTIRGSNAGGADDWVSNFVVATTPVNPLNTIRQASNLPAFVAGFNPLRGSDILVVSNSTALPDLRISLDNTQGNLSQVVPTLLVADADGQPTDSGVANGQIVGVGDCSEVDIFQNRADAEDALFSRVDGGNPGNLFTAANRWQDRWDEEASVFLTTTSVYYVGTGAAGRPSLFRFTTTCGLTAACGDQALAPVELVEGVENMQILYGEDTDNVNPANFSRDGTANIFRSADEVQDFRLVSSVKLGLLVRSPDNALNNNPAQIFPTFNVAEQITIDPPDDRFQRFVNNTTVRLHNRGL